MNQHHKNAIKYVFLLLLQLLGGLVLQGQSSNSKFVFVIDISASMASRSPATSLVVAEMVEKGVSGKINDGDLVEVWTYSDKISTTNLKSIVWDSQESRDISNLIFVFLKNLRYSKKTIAAVSFDNISRFIDIRDTTRTYLYIVTDGTKPITGLPFESELNVVLKQNSARWKSEKIPCIIAILLERNKPSDWAVGEGYPLSPIKTVANGQTPVENRIEKDKLADKAVNEATKVFKELENKKSKERGQDRKTQDIQRGLVVNEAEKSTGELVPEKKREETIIKQETVKQPFAEMEKSNLSGVKKTNELIRTTLTSLDSKQGLPKLDNRTNFTILTPDSSKAVSNKTNTKFVVSTPDNSAGNLNKNTDIKIEKSSNALIFPKIKSNVNVSIEKPLEVKTNQVIKTVVDKTNEIKNKGVKIQDYPVFTQSNTNVVESSEKVDRELVVLRVDTNKNSSAKTNIFIMSDKKEGETTKLMKVDNKPLSESTITQNVAMLQNDKNDDFLLKMATVFAISAFGLWIFAYIKSRTGYRHSLITRGMDKNKISHK
ncbi:MAG: hypothetical protein ACP5MG_08770 [Verrucomicrobiia bacterium]